jgi:plasmid maintenance system antidote protein VapI
VLSDLYSEAVTWLQVQRQVALAEGEKAKRTAQQLLALAHQTSKVTEAYEVSHAAT